MAVWDIRETRSGELDILRNGRGVYYGEESVRDAIKRIQKHRKYEPTDEVRVQLEGEIRRNYKTKIKASDWV